MEVKKRLSILRDRGLIPKSYDPDRAGFELESETEIEFISCTRFQYNEYMNTIFKNIKIVSK